MVSISLGINKQGAYLVIHPSNGTKLRFQFFVYSPFCPAEQYRFLTRSLPRSHRVNDLLRATTVSAIIWCGGTGQTRAGHGVTQAAPGANQLNTLDRSGELGTRTRPAAGQHWHLLHRLTPRVAGRYCCALPDDLQGLHFSRVAASTCMSALDVPRKLKSSVLHSHVGGIGLAWASAHFLLYRKAPLLPSAAGFCAKALVRPVPPPFPDCRRRQRPEGPEGRRCLTIGIFSPRKKLD